MAIIGDPLVEVILKLAQTRDKIEISERPCPPTIPHRLINRCCAAAQTAVGIYKPRPGLSVGGRQAQFGQAVGNGLPWLEGDTAVGPRLHETRRFFSEATVAIVNEQRFVHTVDCIPAQGS
jgi:hypothetical protein